ncbi:MAG: hypothetical protein OER86_04610 [Phycisphaerae bacterium]|nr:hypothetical protein [Phycisphaerae bacterium]
MRWFFTLLIGLSALFIAGCAAVFSVKGLGLLFAGSAVAVMTMAASLEAGKLVAASFLYRYWRELNIPLRIYLFTAVLVLVGVTSLGIYGYLARAYETTHTQVALLESRVTSLDQQIADAHRQIEAERAQLGASTRIDSSSLEARQQRMVEVDKQLENSLARLGERRVTAQDKLNRDIDLQNQQLTEGRKLLAAGLLAEQTSIGQLNDRIAALDRAVDAYTKAGAGRLFKADHVKKGQQLRAKQQPQRAAIDAEIAAHQAAMSRLRESHATQAQAANDKIESLRSEFDTALAALGAEERDLRTRHTQEVAAAESQIKEFRAAGTAGVSDRQNRIDALYQQIRTHEDQTAALRQTIAGTDVGTYRFVARAMGLPVDQVVKWLILVIVLVFDPLAVTLTVGFNVALMRHGKRRNPAAADKHGAAGTTGGPESVAGLRATPWATALTGIFLIAALGAGGYGVTRYVQAAGTSAHARMIPADSFAVATLRPNALANAGNHEALLNLGGLVPGDTVAKLKALAVNGFAADRPIYLFAKYPRGARAGEQDHPVLLVGLVAAIDDRNRAETGLAEFAESVAGMLLPRLSDSTRNSRAMVDYGSGRYLDPEGGFFSYALTGRAAVIMLEMEGDPQAPRVEQEIRHCLDDRAATNAFGEATVQLPDRATAGSSAVAFWFDAQRCFSGMPKNAAAQNRHEMLRRFLAFESVIEIDSIDDRTLRVVGDYRYSVKRFDLANPRSADATAKLVELGPSPDAKTPGLLMDRCADTLEFDSLIARLRQGLSSGMPGLVRPQIVVDKTVDSETSARFELNAVYGEQVDSPLSASVEHLLR